MDLKTIQAYDSNSEFFCKRYRSGKRVQMDRVFEELDGLWNLLEVGTGSGVDAMSLIACGFQYTGLEPSNGLIMSATQAYPELRGKIEQGALPLSEERLSRWRQSFDAVFCSAVLMHVPVELRNASIAGMADVLRSGGRLFLSFSENRGGLDAESRDEFGRLYFPVNTEAVIKSCMHCGLTLMKQWEQKDPWERNGLTWKSLIFEKR